MSILALDHKIAVIGAGSMGAGIAQIAAKAGHTVYLFDQKYDAAVQAIHNTDQQLQRLVNKGKLSQEQATATIARILPVPQLAALSDASLVIEAIIEDLSIKQALFAQLEAICPADTILASNTSSISITALAANLQRPERFVGMHFFNPAPIMALVEVISGLATTQAVADTVYVTAKAWGKTPVYAKSTPGFIVNRVARPFYAESLRMLEEQVADLATLDALLRDAGNFRMGPFELMDLIGHDVNYAVTTSVFAAYYQDPRFKPSLSQKALVDAGRLGRKSGYGFYDYTEGAITPNASTEALATSSANTLIVEGDCCALQALIGRIKASGIEIVERDGKGVLRFGDATLALTDGRMACERSRVEALDNLVLLDLAFDYQTTKRLAIAVAAQVTQQAQADAVALLQGCAISVTLCDDSPGLVVMRTLAALLNEAADAHLQGVATMADIDAAMCSGVNYPQGPFAWTNRVGVAAMYQVLQHIHQHYGDDRYRPSALLRKFFYQQQELAL